MQREEGFELKKKIQSLIKNDNAFVTNNTDVNSLLKSLLEVRMLAKQMYPNNEALQMILDRQDLFKGEQIEHTSTTKTELIIDNAKEIALAIDLRTFNVDDSVRGLDSSNIREASNAVPTDSSDLLPREVAEKIEKSEVRKIKLNAFSTFILAILAGAFIALGGIYFTFATGQVIVTLPFTQVIGGLVFSMGLMFVVITGAQLFTGNNLNVMNLASKKIKVSMLARNWAIVYVGNLIGAVATAGILYMSNAWTNNGYQYGIRALQIASHKVSLGFVEAFFLGILCNCLVCLAIWLAAAGKKISDKILAVIFPVSAFVAMGFEHSVANMYFLSFSLMIKDNPLLLSAMQTAGTTVNTSNIDFMGALQNLLPVTLGNIVGGSIMVGLVYWLAFQRNNKKLN